ncbi:GNAT family N-acetyltransferase [Massilia glaciei]|uniref:N-acetyltransferase n=1 Tax=Massilia glaciei TaxID=1524097 RepID=A0A2U2I6H9_9BURK|nr:GNAT family protein [Massilia glaciei]PWF55342.1 N-acetyltransferase [Massilia glaciei]
MSIVLIPVPLDHLRALAEGRVPATLGYSSEPDALPPAFVAARALDTIARGGAEFWCATFYVLRQGDKMLVGGCGFKGDPEDGKVKIGYAIAPASRGQGVATEAVRQLLSRAFAGGATLVVAEINPANLASVRVVQKLAFAHRDSYVDDAGEVLVRWVAGQV